MFRQSSKRKQRLGVEWVRSEETGETYLCQVGTLQDPKNPSDEELRKYCVIESDNPHND